MVYDIDDSVIDRCLFKGYKGITVWKQRLTADWPTKTKIELVCVWWHEHTLQKDKYQQKKNMKKHGKKQVTHSTGRPGVNAVVVGSTSWYGMGEETASLWRNKYQVDWRVVFFFHPIDTGLNVCEWSKNAESQPEPVIEHLLGRQGQSRGAQCKQRIWVTRRGGARIHLYPDLM